MGNWAEEAFRPYAEVQKQNVLADTWGRLAPEKNKSYKGEILFCKSEYSDVGYALIASNFEGLNSSPWLYDFLNDFIYESTKADHWPDGKVYKIKGTFRNYRMYGKPQIIA